MFSGLAVVIVNWNLKEDTLACLASLIQAGIDPGQIYLVDNGSKDGSVDAFQGDFDSGLHILENDRNLGFAPACNQGIQASLDCGAQWILILNNDTWVDVTFIAAMESAASDTIYSILGPVIFYADKPALVWYLGDRLISGTLITINHYRGRPIDSSLPELIPVDFVSGCAMLVKREVFEAIGLFDASLVMYGEEIDFCYRGRQAGYLLAGVTTAKMWHKVSLSASRDLPNTRYLRVRNQVRFYQRYARGFQRPMMILFTVLRAVHIGLGDMLSGQPGLIHPLVKGLLDGWRAS